MSAFRLTLHQRGLSLSVQDDRSAVFHHVALYIEHLVRGDILDDKITRREAVGVQVRLHRCELHVECSVDRTKMHEALNLRTIGRRTLAVQHSQRRGCFEDM